MTEAHLRQTERQRPLVAVVCAVPLLGEALVSALEFAEVRTFAERGGDVGGLLRWLRPDAVVVDSDTCLDGATEYARASGAPLVHIGVRNRQLRLFAAAEWQHVGDGEGPTPEAIRNVLAGSLFARTERVS